MDKQLWAALEDVHLHSRLTNIARRHLMLALEFGERTTRQPSQYEKKPLKPKYNGCAWKEMR